MHPITMKIVVSTGAIVAALLCVWALERLVLRRLDDEYERFYARKFLRYGIAAVAAGVLVVVWQPFGGQFAAAFGLAAAGIAFAMQEVIGALAGWFNITAGRIFRIGDRIQMAGVRGDVIDITPLRTKLMEIGDPVADDAWVRGRQHTGRMVAISNKATFTEPVFNFSAFFDFIWEEASFGVPHHEDVAAATEVLADEAVRVSHTTEALEAMDELRRRFPVPDAELEPRVFAFPERDVVRLAARFVVPTRTARSVKDDLNRSVLSRFEERGIEVVVTDVLQTGPPWNPVRSPRRSTTP